MSISVDQSLGSNRGELRESVITQTEETITQAGLDRSGCKAAAKHIHCLSLSMVQL